MTKVLVNERQAQSKDCCGPQAANSLHDGTCTGSGCMAWIWWDNEEKGAERRGFCGLVYGGIFA